VIQQENRRTSAALQESILENAMFSQQGETVAEAAASQNAVLKMPDRDIAVLQQWI